jgi:hypothetical protein
MSSTLQQVTRGDNFTGLGYRPDLTPAHHVAAQTGIKGGMPFSSSPRIRGKRRNPTSGRWLVIYVRLSLKRNERIVLAVQAVNQNSKTHLLSDDYVIMSSCNFS